MNWFKFHHDALNDPKVQRLPGDLFKAWINLLCLSSQQQIRGTLPSPDDCAFALRMDILAMADVLNRLANAQLLDRNDDGYVIHGWQGRQYDKPSDAPERVNERVRKHRERKSNADVTPMKRPGNATDTDTERETDEILCADAPKSKIKALPKPVPDDFEVTEKMYGWAEANGWSRKQADRDTEQFLDYHRGKDSRQVDWTATWRTWMRNTDRFGSVFTAKAGAGRGVPA
jgi:hypothetical protein